jgi:phosphate transport system substrate-binding protein
MLFSGLACLPKGVDPRQRIGKEIRISGSDSMLLLTRRWAEEYMKENPGISIYAYGGGTVRGVKDLLNRDVQICAASRPMRPTEVREMAQRFGVVGMTFSVAKEAIVIYLHPSNPLQTLTLDDLRGIFTGQISNWQEIGGVDENILVLNRSLNSGTHLYFKEHILNEGEYTSTAQVFSNTKSIVEKVRHTSAAIGFGGFAYGIDLHCKVDGILPTVKSIRRDQYPITRYLYLMTQSRPSGEVKRFIDWTVSRRGQELVEETGYVALW